MRFLILSRNASLYSTARIVRAARARGHEVDVVDPMRLQFAAVPGAPTLLLEGQPLRPYDAVLPRIGASLTGQGSSAVAQLEQAGLPVLNGANAIVLARDKVRSLQQLAAARVPVPRTVALRSLAGLGEALALVGGCPVVVKLQNGTQGIGTMLADREGPLAALCETLSALGQQVILQEFVREAKGSDVRAFVVGGRVVAAMRRTAADGEFRSNLHRGGTGEGVVLDRRLSRIAIGASAALGLAIAGVDVLDASGAPRVIEVNCSPGLEGIEQATGVDVAAAIVKHAEEVAKGRRRRRARVASPGRRRAPKRSSGAAG